MRKTRITVKQYRSRGSEKTSAISSSYEVVGLVDSVEYIIGQFLSQSDVQMLCRSERWTVTVK